MKKKIYAVMSSAALTTAISSAISTTAFATVDGFLVNNNDKLFLYNYNELMEDSLNKLLGASSPLYDEYIKGNLVAFHDTIKGYVNEKDVMDQSLESLMDGKNFDLDSFTESAKDEQIYKIEGKNVTERIFDEKKETVVDKKEKEAKAELKVESVSAITKTEVTVKLTQAVKDATADKFQVKANGTDVKVEKAEKVAADLTGKTYKLTVATLANKEGKLAVNGVEKDFDFKAPEVTSIVAKGTKAVEVTFNEAIKDTTAIQENFVIKKAIGDFVTGNTKPVLSADGTKVTLTWTGNGSLTVADYVLVLGETAAENDTNRVKDVAGNSIYGGTEVSFKPTADQLKVKEAASITTAEYNNGNGELVLTFNKDVSVDNVNLSKLTIGGVEIPSDSVKAQSEPNGVKITLAGDAKKALDAISGEISLVGAKEAWKDAEFATEGQTIVVSKVSPAVIKSAAYNQETKVLTVNFDQPVKDLVLANIKVNDAQGLKKATATAATNADGTDLDVTKAKATWELKLSDNEAKNLEDVANNKKELKIYMDEAAVKNDNKKDIPNVKTTYADGGVEVKYTADETKPYLVKAEYFNKLGEEKENVLKLTFNEALDDASLNNMKKLGAVKISTSANGEAVDLNGLNVATTCELDEAKKVLTVEFKDVDVAGRANKIDAQYLSQKPIKVWFDKDVLQDKNGLKSEATTFENGMELTYKDFIAPKLEKVEALNEEYVKVEFNEPLDKASAENIKNYEIIDERDQKLNILSAQVQSDRKTVYLKTEKQEYGRPYELRVENIRDTQLNSINHGDPTRHFYGKGNKVEGKLKLDSVVVAAPSNSNNDTLKVTFSEAVNQAEALNLVNYAILEASAVQGHADQADWGTENDPKGKAVSLEGAKAEIDATGKVVTITLGKANLQNGKFYRVAVSNIKDIYGNSLTGKTTVDSKALNVAGNLAKPTVVEGNTKENAVKLTFKEELNKTEAEKVTNYKITGNEITKAVYSWDAEKKEAIVTLDVKTALANTAPVLLHKNVTNLAGKAMADDGYNKETNTMAEIKAPDKLIDTVAPTIDKVEAKIKEGAENDTITITFKDKDILEASAKVADNYIIKDSKGNVIGADTYTFGNLVKGGNGDTLTLTFNGKDKKAYDLQSAEEYSIFIKGVMDTSGNKLAETTKKIAWAADSDKAAPTITNLNVIKDNGGTPGKIEITLNELVNKEDAKNLANYVVEVSADGNDWKTKLTPIMAEYDGATKVTLYVKEELKDAAEGNKYRVTVKNVKDLAGNVDAKGSI